MRLVQIGKLIAIYLHKTKLSKLLFLKETSN